MNFRNLKLTTEMYEQNEDFCTVLEGLDPQYHYIGTEYQNTTAFQRQLIRFNINQNSIIDDFFQCDESAIFFPQYVLHTIQKGRESAKADIYAITTHIENLDYRGMHLRDGRLLLNEGLCKFHKTSASLAMPYETLRFQKLSVFENCLLQLGRQIAESEMKNLVGILKKYAVPVYESDVKGSAFEQLRCMGLDTIISSCVNDSNDNGLNIKRIYYPAGNVCIGLRKDSSIERVIYGRPTIDYEALINKEFKNVSIGFTEGYNILNLDTIAEAAN